MVACARGTSDRVTRGESHARTVAKGSRWSASPVGVDGLFSFSKHRALATEGLDTCTGLPLPVVSAAMPGMIPVPGGGTNPAGSFAGDFGGWSGMLACVSGVRGPRSRSPHFVAAAEGLPSQVKKEFQVKRRGALADDAARPRCTRRVSRSSRARIAQIRGSATGDAKRRRVHRARRRAQDRVVNFDRLRNGHITPGGPSGQTWKGPR